MWVKKKCGKIWVKKIWVKTIWGSKHLGFKNIWVPAIFWAQPDLDPKNGASQMNLSPKIYGLINFRLKYVLGPNKFCLIKFLFKNFLFKNICFSKIWGPKKNCHGPDKNQSCTLSRHAQCTTQTPSWYPAGNPSDNSQTPSRQFPETFQYFRKIFQTLSRHLPDTLKSPTKTPTL